MFAEGFFLVMFQSVLKGMASGIGSVAIQPAAKFILKLLDSKYRISVIKRNGNKIYKTYNDKEISEIVCEWIMITIRKTFQENSKETVCNLLRFISTPNKFKEYLINYSISYLDDSSILEIDKSGSDYLAYEEMISELVNEIYDNNTLTNYLSFLTKNQLEVLEFEQLSTIIAQLNDHSSEFKVIISLLKKIMEILSEKSHAGTTFIPSSKIKDQNDEYIKRYSMPLFLEESGFPEDKCNDKNALLSDTFVEPMLYYRNKSCVLKNVITTWANDFDNRSKGTSAKIFLLYGKAGGGKTSLVSHIIDKNILGENCHTIALRSCINVFSEENMYNENGSRKSMWQLVKECFECLDDSQYENKVFILDGLDEICVLQREFNGREFLDELSAVKVNNIKILVMSRNGGYFDQPQTSNDLTFGTIIWTDKKVEEWCNRFSSIHSCRKEWCNKFPDMLKNTKKKFQDAICTPIILYICCICKVDISKESSIAGIYDEAFSRIGYREHDPNKTNKNLQNQDKRQHEVNWQYTKELAFQMFLNNKLEAVVAENDMNVFSVKRTKDILGKGFENIKPELGNYFAICHFTSKKGDIIEFAHKTMGEYFTAVKLYEDYFRNIFKNNANERGKDEKVWQAIFSAFRYAKISKDIIRYLSDIIKKREDNTWCNCFFECYYRGILNELIWKQSRKEAIYQTNYTKIVNQIAISFRNLTWLLTSLGFKNDSEISKSLKYRRRISDFFIRDTVMDVNCSQWKNLYNINLCYANLTQADFSYAELRGSNLSGANLSFTDLSHSDLTCVDLRLAYFNSNSCKDISPSTVKEVILLKLSGAILYNIVIMESDLPKYDETFSFYKNHFTVPRINTRAVITDKKKSYNSKTNRMESL